MDKLSSFYTSLMVKSIPGTSQECSSTIVVRDLSIHYQIRTGVYIAHFEVLLEFLTQKIMVEKKTQTTWFFGWFYVFFSFFLFFKSKFKHMIHILKVH